MYNNTNRPLPTRHRDIQYVQKIIKYMQQNSNKHQLKVLIKYNFYGKTLQPELWPTPPPPPPTPSPAPINGYLKKEMQTATWSLSYAARKREPSAIS